MRTCSDDFKKALGHHADCEGYKFDSEQNCHRFLGKHFDRVKVLVPSAGASSDA